MGFKTAVETCFHKYADFNGRASLSEYWWWYLFTIIIGFFMNFAEILVAALYSSSAYEDPSAELQILGFSFLIVLIQLGLMLPGISVCARRLHDVGKSGWWMLLPLTIIGIIPFFVWTVSMGNEEANEYGPAPVLE